MVINILDGVSYAQVAGPSTNNVRKVTKSPLARTGLNCCVLFIRRVVNLVLRIRIQFLAAELLETFPDKLLTGYYSPDRTP